MKLDRASTGIVGLDDVLGGGFPHGQLFSAVIDAGREARLHERWITSHGQ